MVAADNWPECEGSDHCPVWADLQLEAGLPVGHVAPALSSSHTLQGRWLWAAVLLCRSWRSLCSLYSTAKA